MRTTVIFSAAALFTLSGIAEARPADETFPRPRNGIVKEETNSSHIKTATVWLTDKTGADIPTIGWPKKGTFVRGSPATFQIPPAAQIDDPDPKKRIVVDVIDVHQRVEQGVTGPEEGAINDLKIEAIYRDDSNGDYLLGNVFGCLANHTGWFNEVRIPDLFGDTNGDGVIGSGDEMFSLIDLNVFLDAPYPYQLGDLFSIVNGVATGPSGVVPGMVFSSTPFSFSPAAGFTTDGLFSGLGLADTEHGVTPVPAPGALMLVTMGLAGLVRRHR